MGESDRRGQSWLNAAGMMVLMGGGDVVLAPIMGSDVPEVAAYLHDALNGRLSAEQWAGSIVPPWACEAPNHGFHLRAEGVVVGAALAFYSDRVIDARVERVCNLGAWCVADEYRSHGLRLLRALIGQPGYHFTDLSPSGNVVALNERLKFQHLDTTTVVAPNVPSMKPSVRLIADPERIAGVLCGVDRQIFEDHRSTAATRHVVLEVDGRHVYVIFRKDRRKGLPIFASLLYVSDPRLMPRVWGRFAAHLLGRHGALATLVEQPVLAWRPSLAFVLGHPRPKMYRSTALRAGDIDYLYSELTCVAW